MKLFLRSCHRTVQVLRQAVGGDLQCTGWDRVTRLQRAMPRLGHQLSQFLVRRLECGWQKGRSEKESCKNGTEACNTLLDVFCHRDFSRRMSAAERASRVFQCR